MSNPLIEKFGDGKVYLHQNVKVREGGRYATAETLFDFCEFFVSMKKLAVENGLISQDNNEFYSWFGDEMVRQSYLWDKKLHDDLSGKVKLNFDVVEIEDTDYMTKSGVPYLRGVVYGYSQIPVRFFLYPASTGIRGYIPTKGNLFNRETKKPFGLESLENGDGYYIAYDVFPDIYKQFKWKEIMKEFDYSRLDFQDDWCLEAFERRLEIR